MAASELIALDQPQQSDLDKCVHCGLCLNACPTYRELRVEMDSPRGRIYQMAQVASGAADISPSYIEHIDLCLACRGCETACPSGVRYGRLVEAARAQIENNIQRPRHIRWLRSFFFGKLLPSRTNLGVLGTALYLYQVSGLKWLVRVLGFLPAQTARNRSSRARCRGAVLLLLLRKSSSRRRTRAATGSPSSAAASPTSPSPDSTKPPFACCRRTVARFPSRAIRPAAARCMCTPAFPRKRARWRGATSTRCWQAISTRSSPTPPAADPRSRNTASCSNTTRTIRKRPSASPRWSKTSPSF